MQDIYKILEDLKIAYEKFDHPPVFTCEESDKYNKDNGGARIKNLFLRDKKGRKHFLAIFESSRDIDFKKLSEEVNESKLGFASEERLEKYLGLKTGSVSPFGLINDKKKEVIVIFDVNLRNHEKLNFHPNDNTATIQISASDFLKFIDWCRNKVIEV